MSVPELQTDMSVALNYRCLHVCELQIVMSVLELPIDMSVP